MVANEERYHVPCLVPTRFAWHLVMDKTAVDA